MNPKIQMIKSVQNYFLECSTAPENLPGKRPFTPEAIVRISQRLLGSYLAPSPPETLFHYSDLLLL